MQLIVNLVISLEKHAYLIIANRNPHQLETLLTTLDDTRNDIYILIDRKSVENFNKKYRLNYSSINVLDPINIFWGDYSQIQAELNLFKAATSNHKYAYYHLLSGLDLPLVNQDKIHNFFDMHPNKEFITYSRAISQKELSKRIHTYHFTKKFRDRDNAYLNLYRKIENYVFKFIPESKVPVNKIGFGSNWVSIDDELARSLVKADSQINKIFKNGYLVDELVIPTYLNLYPKFKSKVYYKAAVNDKPNEFQGNLRYINWWDGSPYVWKEKDYFQLQKAVKMGHLFSRKFDENVDSKIIEKVVMDDLT